jgi:hypothetical protein
LIGALARWPKTFRHPVFRERVQRFIAGWSSPVARQALKVIGSNPIPATKMMKKPRQSEWIAGFFDAGIDRNNINKPGSQVQITPQPRTRLHQATNVADDQRCR